MGAYLSQPVTEKETYFGSNQFLEYGGASMQGWRKSMEDAHIAVLDLGNNTHAAMFGVFDGHGGSEVAKFCQRYMAEEITKLEHYHQGRLGDSLVEVFHKIDLMLKDQQYSGELEGWKRLQHDKLNGEQQGPNAKAQNEQVSNTEAVNLLRHVLALRNKNGKEAAEQQPGLESTSEPMNTEAVDDAAGPSTSAPSNPSTATPSLTGPTAELPASALAPDLSPTIDLAQADPTMETTDVNKSPKALDCRIDPEPAQIQAGCTAVVAVFQGDKLFVANAGDSRAVLCRHTSALALSEDHKPASEGEKNRIQAAGGFISTIGGVVRVNGNLNLSRAIGDLKYKSNEQLAAAEQIISAQPDVTEIKLGPQDRFLVLACDGVWDVKSNQEVVDFVAERLAEGMRPAEAASHLLDACLANDPADTRGIGCDNMTATIVVLKSLGSQQ